MNGACQDEDWLKIPVIGATLRAFKHHFHTVLYENDSLEYGKIKLNFSATATFSFSVSNHNIVES